MIIRSRKRVVTSEEVTTTPKTEVAAARPVERKVEKAQPTVKRSRKVETPKPVEKAEEKENKTE